MEASREDINTIKRDIIEIKRDTVANSNNMKALQHRFDSMQRTWEEDRQKAGSRKGKEYDATTTSPGNHGKDVRSAYDTAINDCT